MRSSLRNRLGSALLVVAIVPTVATGIVVFTSQRKAIGIDRLERLSAIANVQEQRVEAWVQSSEGILSLILSRTRLRVLQREIQGPALSAGERGQLALEMSGILSDADAASDDVIGIHTLDRSGIVVASTDRSQIGADLSRQPYVVDAEPDRPSLSHLARIDGELVAVHGGVVELDGETIGWVVVLQRWREVIKILTDRSGLGDTGEAILARRDPATGSVISLGPLLGIRNGSLKELPMAGEFKLSAQRAADGQRTDALNASDYRGEAVVAATRRIDRTDWGLVVKQDRVEILAATAGLRTTLITAAGVTALLAVVVAWLLADRLTRHIADLTATARRIARGDRSARATIRTKGEMAELAVAFNRMTDELVGHEQELETRKIQLESFLYVSSHDLKTPLRSVSSFSQLLRLDYGAALDERATHYLQRIETGATRTIDVIDDLLAYVRVDHNHHERETVDVTAAAVSARELLGSSVVESGAEVTIEDLGRAEGNRALLVQLFQNLIGNALKYTRPGVAPVVTVSSGSGPGRNGSGAGELVFVVADNGVGVPEQFRSRVFAPFERLQNAEEVAGTGLGLAVCERIVALHHGTIEFVDSPLGGAAVQVALSSNPET